MIAANRRRGGGGSHKSHRRRAKHHVSGNPPRRLHRRHFRRNPPGGFIGATLEALKGGVAVVGGEMAGNLVSSYVPPFLKDASGVETNTGAAVRKLAGAVAVGAIARMIFGRSEIAKFAAAGAVASPVRAVVRPILPATGPVTAALLGGFTPGRIGSYPAMNPGTSLSSYPRLAGVPSRGVGPTGLGDATDDVNNYYTDHSAEY
jgi:hypothetical protein